MKTRTIPHQFWMRYRQILFFKVLKYNVRKQKKKKRKLANVSNLLTSYKSKLLKKTFIAFLEHVFLNKRKSIIN